MSRDPYLVMSAAILQANARNIPLVDNSVDLIVTSPPYFALRSYQDGGEHYDGQIGSETTPAEFLNALLEVTRECVRVLKPSGSMFVNLGDKYAAGHGGSSTEGNGVNINVGHSPSANFRERDDLPNPPASWGKRDATGRAIVPGFRPKTLMGMPWRYAIRCIDELGFILRAEIIWSKPNGLPESVTDRVRRSHEQWFHFVQQPRYFSAVDEIREDYEERFAANHKTGSENGRKIARVGHNPDTMTGERRPPNPLGKLPGSVWTIPTEPLTVPEHVGVDHFAAFPTEWPRRLIQGWSPAGVCTACGEGRRPVVDQSKDVFHGVGQHRSGAQQVKDGADTVGWAMDEKWRTLTTIISYACACPQPTAPTIPAVVLDPFGGTGTVALVAAALGRHGISIDMSADYSRLARWRTSDPRQLARAARKPWTPPREQIDGQMPLFDEAVS